MRRAAAIALAVLGLAPGAAHAATLSGPARGPVDIGDRVPYRVAGAGCERVKVTGRITGGPDSRTISGPASTGRPADDDECAGVAQLPDFNALRATGWEPGDPIAIELTSPEGTIPLRYARMEADQGQPSAGTPEVVDAGDQDTGSRDRAVALDPGDAVSLGRVDLRRAEALALRLCIEGLDTSSAPPTLGPFLTPQRLEPPTFISIRQDSPSGSALIGPIDVASDPQELSRLTTMGFGGCYRLVVLPITGRLQEDAPELFLRGEQGAEGVLRVNSVDVAGTGAKTPTAAPPAPAGMRTIFDGRSFAGWEQQNCVLRDGAAVNARADDSPDISGCTLTYPEPLRDVVLRFRMRREHIYDNAGIYLGAQEIQLRSVGEYLPGGYFGQFAARWQKLNRFPDWSEIEVIQLGARHVVTVNGRTVTDVMREGGAPDPFTLQLVAQPQWSYRVGAEAGFGNEGFPDITRANELGAFWFQNVRLLRCAGADDAVCRRLADARRGQVPVPEGAPAPLPPESAARRCGARRTVRLRLPRSVRRVIRVTVDGRRTSARRGARDVRVRVEGRRRGRYAIRITARTPSGRTLVLRRTAAACT